MEGRKFQLPMSSSSRCDRSVSTPRKRRDRKRDSGVLSDVDYTKFNTMSSGDSDKQDSCNSLNYSFSDSVPSSGGRYDYSTGSSSRSAESGRFTAPPTVQEGSAMSSLPELGQVPWTEADVLRSLQQGKASTFCENLSVECLQRFSYLLQRPLIRIAREAKRLCETLNKCTKYEVQTACKIILPSSLYEQCDKYSSQAVILYSMGPRDMNTSRSSRCGLSLSVGKHHRWMVEAQVAGFVHELASVYFTACMENLVEKTIFSALSKEDLAKPVITTEMLENGILQCAQLHGIFHSQSHLATGREALDPVKLNLLGTSQRQRLNQTLYKTIESNLLSTCVSSLSELGDILTQAMQHWYNKSTLLWSGPAMKSLLYYMKCSVLDCCDSSAPLISIVPIKSSTSAPTIMEWMRVCMAFTEYRHDTVIDTDDIAQAARVLLPNVDCPIRAYRIKENQPGTQDSNVCLESYQRDLAFTMLSSGRCDLIPHAKTLLGKSGLDHVNAGGMTLLMTSCISGDEAMAQALVEAGASLDVRVPAANVRFPAANLACHGWTALCFAVASKQVSVVKLLLDSGCCVEGGADVGGDNFVDTPLQLACALGHMELVTLLINKSADPYQNTLLLGGFGSTGLSNAFTLAANHGHRGVLQRLFKHPINSKISSLLSLSEILAETSLEDQLTQKLNMCNRLRNTAEETENEYMVIENDYMTVEELREHDMKMHLLENKLAVCQLETLKDALYGATEHGYLDITLEINSMGLPWTLYTWYMALNTAHILQRKAILQTLLRDFTSLTLDPHMQLFIKDCLPLMLDIFRESKNEIISQQLASIFSRLFGKQPVPVLKEIRNHPTSVIDASYVNSPQLSDISFIVEGRIFYAHKIILINASNRFKSILSSFNDSPSPEIEINEIAFSTFELMMQYLYSGVGHMQLNGGCLKAVKDLLGAAHYFQLDGLKRKCEIILSKSLTLDTCVSTYKSAKIYGSADLVEFCEAFFLQHLPELLACSDNFKKVLFSRKAHNRELLDRLSMALAGRLNLRSPRLTNSSNALRKSISCIQ